MLRRNPSFVAPRKAPRPTKRWSGTRPRLRSSELEGPEPALRLALRSLNRQALNRWSLTQYLNLGSRGLRRAGRRGADRPRRRGRRGGEAGAPPAGRARRAATRPPARLDHAPRFLP